MADEPSNPPVGGWRRVAPDRLALGGLIAAIVIARYLLTRPAFFTQDDFIYFGDARAKGLTWNWLSTEWFQHFAPGHRLAFWAMSATPASWTIILLLESALTVLALVWLYASLELLFERSWLNLAPVVILGCSIVLVPPFLWPSAGLQQVPDLTCALGSVWAYLRWQKAPSARWVWLCAGLMAIGLLFYIRPLLIPVYILLIRLFILQEDLHPRAIWDALWKERWIWGALGVVALIYVAHYLLGGYRGDSGPGASFATVRAFVRISWLRNLWPAALGREVHQYPSLHGADLRSEVGGQVLFLVLVGLSLARNGLKAWRGWAFVLSAEALTLLLVAFGRLGILGPGVGYDLRYITNLAWLVPLGVMVALRRPRAASAAPPALRASLGPATFAVGGFCLLYAISALHTASVKQDNWFGHFSRSWVDQARASLAQIDAGGKTARVRNGIAPDYVIQGGFVPANRLANVLPALGRRVAFDDPRGPEYVVDPSGRVVPGKFIQAWQGSAPCATGPKEVQLAVTPFIPAGDQLIVRTPGATIPPGGVKLFVDPGTGFPGTTDHVLRPGPGGVPTVDLHEGSLGKLQFEVPAGQRLCLPTVQAGPFSAAAVAAPAP